MTVPVCPISHLSTHATITTHWFQASTKIPPDCDWFANLTNTNAGRPDPQDINNIQATAGLRWPGVF